MDEVSSEPMAFIPSTGPRPHRRGVSTRKTEASGEDVTGHIFAASPVGRLILIVFSFDYPQEKQKFVLTLRAPQLSGSHIRFFSRRKEFLLSSVTLVIGKKNVVELTCKLPPTKT